jgi:hypothetical protein
VVRAVGLLTRLQPHVKLILVWDPVVLREEILAGTCCLSFILSLFQTYSQLFTHYHHHHPFGIYKVMKVDSNV